MTRRPPIALALAALAACARPASGPPVPPPAPAGADAVTAPRVAADAAAAPRDPLLPPRDAWAAGFMPLGATGIPQFRAARPTADGRGILIAILDSGIDPGTQGLISTTTGGAKILDLRDFSGEGAVALTPATRLPDGSVVVGGRTLRGARRAGRVAVGDAWYGGVFRERPLGPLPASDANGNGTNTDEFPLLVVRASDGWVVFLDSNLDGSFEDEMPLHDYRHGREAIALGTRPLTIAANLADSAGAPRLDLYFDTSGHGTFVAGIAAGHNLFNVTGFDGVAPGASLLGLKVANNARGGLSVSGSFIRALEYAARFATERALPLVVNLSFGVGNEREGRATIDSVIDAFLAGHPDVVFTVSAGNDGPGISTVGFPATADRVLTVGSTFPGVFARPEGDPAPDRLGVWSSRGGESAKPELVAPGMAFSTVPRWDVGNEVQAGTSFSAPHVAGLAACLISALRQEGRPYDAALVVHALRASARRLPGGSVLDQGDGVPRLESAYRWLMAGHQGSLYAMRARSGWSAALRRDGLDGAGDTLETFTVRHLGGLRAGRFLLRSDASWLRAPDTVVAAPGETRITLRYLAEQLRTPGLYVGTVTARHPGDTLAGPLFRLVNTVVVPHDLEARPLADLRRHVPAGRVERYFLRVHRPGATLLVTVTLPDSSAEEAAVALFEPSGQPFRDAPEGLKLGRTAGTVRLMVPADDLVPGVYELTVTAAPLGPPAAAIVNVHAALAPVTVAAGAEGFELSNPHETPAELRVEQRVVGVEQRLRVAGRGAKAESVLVSIPPWARRVTVEVAVSPDQWSAWTDLGVTLFDSAGQQVAQEPQNYALARLAVSLDSARAAQPLLLELFPAWADAAASRPWAATVALRIPLEQAVLLGEPSALRIVPGGRVLVPYAPAAVAAPGFEPLIEITAANDAERPAVRRAASASP